MMLPQRLQKLENDSELNDILAEAKKLPPDAKAALMRYFYSLYQDRAVPPLDAFLYDNDYLGLGKTDVYRPVVGALHIIDDPTVHEIFVCAGKGSGKSTLVSLAQARMLYRVLSYVNPHEYFNLMPGALIALVNMSISSRQAINVIFYRFKTFLQRIHEFQKVPKRMFLKFKETAGEDYRVKDFFGKERVDVDLYQEVIGAVHFVDKAVIALSGHSRVESFLGYDIIFGSLDEWSRFPRPKTKLVSEEDASNPAEETYHGIQSQAFSRFPEHYKMIGISSPWSKVDDPVYSRYEALKDIGVAIEI